MKRRSRLMTASIAVLTLSVWLGSPPPAEATVDPEVEVKGAVISFDDKTVNILNQGSVTVVPRSAAPKKIQKGDVIRVSFNLDEFKKTLPAKK